MSYLYKYSGVSAGAGAPDFLCRYIRIRQKREVCKYIPTSIIELESESFADCISLKSISIPNSVTSISNHWSIQHLYCIQSPGNKYYGI